MVKQIVLAEWSTADDAVVSVIFCGRGPVLWERYPDPAHAGVPRAIVIDPRHLRRLSKAMMKARAIVRKTGA